MELRHLEHFVVLAEELSFTKAAARLRIVQSGLSVSIRKLEKDLGAVLFDRTTHTVSLSQSGEALLPEARRVLRDADAARAAVAAVRGVVRGRLRIGMMQSLALIDAAALFATYHRAHPGVVIEPRPAPGGATTLTDRVRRGDLDLAFAWQPKKTARGLRVATLTSEPFVLVTPSGRQLPKGELTVGDLDGEPFVELPEGWGARAVSDQAFREAGVDRRIAVEAADTLMCAELVRAGFGVAILPKSQADRMRGLTSRSVTGLPGWGVSLIAPAGRPLTAAADAFTRLVCTTFGVALSGDSQENTPTK
jgi:DNA-binding transcriptional LysR family regulator